MRASYHHAAVDIFCIDSVIQNRCRYHTDQHHITAGPARRPVDVPQDRDRSGDRPDRRDRRDRACRLRRLPSVSQPTTQTAQNTAPAASVPAPVTNPPSATTIADSSVAQPPAASAPAGKPAVEIFRIGRPPSFTPRCSNSMNMKCYTKTKPQSSSWICIT